ncbi:MAG: hypothetical protein QM727_13200 [Niabella sp.]
MKDNREKSAVTQFLKKLTILLLPFFIMMAIYLHDDPFMVLRHYERYDPSTVLLDEDYVGWQTYMNNRDTIPLDSFIMGNSCTMAFPCGEWEKHLEGGRAIRLFGNAEGIIAIYQKLEALDRLHVPIKNVLMVLDKTSLGKCQTSYSHTCIQPPEVSGISKFKFQETFCQAFFRPGFVIPYFDYKISHKYRPYMQGIINPYGAIRQPMTNDAINPREEMIRKEGEKYWENHKDDFIKKSEPDYRNGKYKEAPPVLLAKQIDLLNKIKGILDKNNTSLKIIISPDFNQVSINKADLKQLNRIFGADTVFDFTGINEYTTDIHNYYEKSHYRPVLGIKLMNKIYGSNNDKMR